MVEGRGQDGNTPNDEVDAAEAEQIKGAKITVVGKTEDVTLEIVRFKITATPLIPVILVIVPQVSRRLGSGLLPRIP